MRACSVFFLLVTFKNVRYVTTWVHVAISSFWSRSRMSDMRWRECMQHSLTSCHVPVSQVSQVSQVSHVSHVPGISGISRRASDHVHLYIFSPYEFGLTSSLEIVFSWSALAGIRRGFSSQSWRRRTSLPASSFLCPCLFVLHAADDSLGPCFFVPLTAICGIGFNDLR